MNGVSIITNLYLNIYLTQIENTQALVCVAEGTLDEMQYSKAPIIEAAIDISTSPSIHGNNENLQKLRIASKKLV